jgi:rSAM/selenodomain-associated transferase 2
MGQRSTSLKPLRRIGVPDKTLLSIVVPILNEQQQMPSLLAHLLPFRERGCEIIMVDGGSRDDSVRLASAGGYQVITSKKGRARQMNAGLAASHGDILLFLHADSRLPAAADELVLQTMAARDRAIWGRFDVSIVGAHAMLPVIAFCMNLRSRLSGIATGDQAIFVRRNALLALGGFADQALMEDIDLSARLRNMAWPLCLRPPVMTSGRRWEHHGVWRTIWLMWRLRLAYWLGADPAELAEQYVQGKAR